MVDDVAFVFDPGSRARPPRLTGGGKRIGGPYGPTVGEGGAAAAVVVVVVVVVVVSSC